MGPRPLPLYLALEGRTFLTSCAVSTILKSGLPNWSAIVPADLRGAVGAAPEAFGEAVDAEARRRFALFLDGVAKYRAHRYRRRLADPPPAGRFGSAMLRDYAPQSDGLPILVVPSLINRGYILDLNGRRSFLRHLARRGFRPFLVDWDMPGEAEMAFDLTAYIARRLEPMLDAVRAAAGRAPVVLGYCMGGLLALALVQRRAADVAGYVALATPWNFHADKTPQMRTLMAARPTVAHAVETMGHMPVDLLQAMFSSLDPRGIARKFRAFAQLPQDSLKAKSFVALEDWLNDGVPLAGPVARECLLGWYGDNTPHRGAWRVDGEVVDPARLGVPALFVIPAHDRIVPPESASALADAAVHAERLHVPLGHVGMIAGTAAVRRVYGPVVRWLRRVATQ